jgi:TolB-like protein
MSSLFSELKRRNVIRVAVLYGVVSWLILQVSDIAMPALGLPEWSITLVLYFLAIGLPIALIFAWAFELTPEGLKRTKEVDPNASVTPATGQKINHLIISVLSIALVFVIVHSYVLEDDGEPAGEPMAESRDAEPTPVVDPTQQPALTSIAVLPFDDMSPANDQEYFTDGISEELLNLLAKIPDFKVAGRTSSFAFKGRNDDLRIIGEKLGVQTILEGSDLRSATRRRLRHPGRDRHRGRLRAEADPARRGGQGRARLGAYDVEHGSLRVLSSRQAHDQGPDLRGAVQGAT